MLKNPQRNPFIRKPDRSQKPLYFSNFSLTLYTTIAYYTIIPFFFFLFSILIYRCTHGRGQLQSLVPIPICRLTAATPVSVWAYSFPDSIFSPHRGPPIRTFYGQEYGAQLWVFLVPRLGTTRDSIIPIRFTRPLCHGCNQLHTPFPVPQRRPPQPPGMNLGTYNIQDGRGFGLP